MAAVSPGPAGRSPPFHARYRAAGARLPVQGGPPDALHSLPDDRLRYLVALLHDTPQRPPALTPEEWRAFLDLLRSHGVAPLLAHRFRSWPEDCRPPAGVAERLDTGPPDPDGAAVTTAGRARRRDGRGHARRRSPVHRR